ncbi:MAG TPA: glutaminyl-peptide cyclotransferase [Thermoanaerobaculia bacterium]|jgi:glutaminyl-peptide cyclotransferase|nr:glutaminyl-peptide cyclotransferase [Thermoanaerobaculia bacterium]
MLVGRLSRSVLMAFLAASLSFCSPGKGASSSSAAPTPAPAPPTPGKTPERLRVKIVSTRPHDTSAYTQGLVWDHGTLYESAGLYSESTLRQVDPATGAIKRQIKVPDRYFAEGLALVGDRLVQLTWQEGTAFVYRASDFEKIRELSYQGEGWGLCNDGKRLIQSDGSDRLTFRDPETFAVLGTVQVRMGGAPIDRLNELECVDGAVYANIYMTEDIMKIDPATGEVTAVISAAGLLSAADYQAGAEVLNGIAWMPETKTFLITGKHWPLMFEVQFVP